MPLAPLSHAPKLINLPLTATGVAPTLLRTDPFRPGNMVVALSASTAALRGGSFDRATAKKSLRFIVPAAAVSTAANRVGVAGTWNAALTQVVGNLTLTFGNAARQLLDDGSVGIPDYTTAADADEALKVVVLVNGVPFGRIVDATSPAPAAGQWGMDNDTNDNFNIVLFADATNFIPVGAEIEVLMVAKIGALAQRNATTGAMEAGSALTAGVMVNRRLGVVEAVTDTAGRSTVALSASDVVMSEVAAAALLGTSL